MKPEPVSISARYLLGERLGAGGMGLVYRAFDRLTQQPVALKQILVNPDRVQHNSVGSDPLLGLATEFRTLASLRHPHIVPVLDYGFDDKLAPYYTMTLLDDARSLTDYGRSLDDAGKVRLLVNLLQALAYLHRRGIIHRDLKPSNILITPDARLWVLDFGLAMTPEISAPSDSGVTGTLPYMAPELFTDTPASVASDLYAVGVMLFELWANRHPFASQERSFVLMDALTRPADISPLPPALAFLAARLLSKTPAERPAWADIVIAELCTAMDMPLPPESLTVRESFLQASTFVGREAEFATLRSALDNALAGGSAFWLVGGESGVGKSRLLDELRTHALMEGALVLWGQAVAEGGLPFQVWREMTRRLALDSTLTDLEAGVLKALAPDIGVLLGREVPDAAELSGQAGQDRLVSMLVEVLKRQDHPVVLLLEDLQWADENLAPLKRLLDVRDQLRRLLVIATYRDDERPNLPQELTGVSVLKLPRLSVKAVAALARGMLGEAGERPDVVQLLQSETEGNAFFMVETVRALAEEAGSLAAVGINTLPHAVLAGGVQRIIAKRLDRMPEAYRPLLRRVAVAGRQLDLVVLNQLAEGESERFLTVCSDASVLELADGTWRFAHDKLREGVLKALSAEALPILYREVAIAIEAAHPADTAYHEALLGYWQAAGDTARELHYLLPVIKKLIKIRGAYAQAEVLNTRGLSLVGENDVRYAMLMNWRAESHWRRGDCPAAQEDARGARTLAERLGVPEEIATSLYNLGVVSVYLGDYAAAQDYYQQSLALHRAIGDQESIASTLNNLGIVASSQGDYAAAQDYQHQSLALRRAIGDQRGVAISLNNLGVIAWSQGDYVAAQNYNQQSLALRRAIGDQQGIATSLNNLGTDAHTQGDYAAARDYHQQSLVLGRAIGDKAGIIFNLTSLGAIARSQGDYAAAQDYYQQSLTLAHAIGNQESIANNLDHLSRLAFEQHDATVLAYLREGLTLSLDIHARSITAAQLATTGRWATRAGQTAHAARLAGLIEGHPATLAETRHESQRTLMRELEALLPADELAALIAEGAKLDLEATAREWLARLEALEN